MNFWTFLDRNIAAAAVVAFVVTMVFFFGALAIIGPPVQHACPPLAATVAP